MRMVGFVLLLGIAALPPGGLAQTAPAPSPGGTQAQQAAPQAKELAVAPQGTGANSNQAPPTRGARSAGGGPANICRELVAFLEPKRAPAQPAAAGQPGPNPASSAAGGSVQGSGQPAPVPQAPPGATPPPGGYDEAKALADANDLQGCQKSAQKLRRAGLPLPPGLIALAALKPELLGAAKP